MTVITLWHFRPKGYCRFLSLSVHPSVRPWSLPSPQNNWSHIWARITKFAPNMHPGILSAGIENRSHWLWSSRSFWSFWLRILGNSSCPCKKSSHIYAGITKFAPNLHQRILLSGVENRGHWPWPSMCIWPFWIRILVNLAWLCNNLKWIEPPNSHQICILRFS